MSANFASTSNSRTFDPTALPPRWLDCPRKSAIIAGNYSQWIFFLRRIIIQSFVDKFIAFKTPLDDRYKDKIHIASRWTCGMLIKAVHTEQVHIDLFFRTR